MDSDCQPQNTIVSNPTSIQQKCLHQQKTDKKPGNRCNSRITSGKQIDHWRTRSLDWCVFRSAKDELLLKKFQTTKQSKGATAMMSEIEDFSNSRFITLLLLIIGTYSTVYLVPMLISQQYIYTRGPNVKVSKPGPNETSKKYLGQ